MVRFVSCASRGAVAITYGPPVEIDYEDDLENEKSGIYCYSVPSIHEEDAAVADDAERPSSASSINFLLRLRTA